MSSLPFLTKVSSSMTKGGVVGIVIVIFLVVFLAVDATCCYRNHCGLLMSISVKLFGQKVPGLKMLGNAEGNTNGYVVKVLENIFSDEKQWLLVHHIFYPLCMQWSEAEGFVHSKGQYADGRGPDSGVWAAHRGHLRQGLPHKAWVG